MSQTYNRSYVYRDNVNNAVYFDDFIGIGPGSAGFQGYPSGPTGITGSYIFHDNTTSFINSGTGETGFKFIYVSGETGPINLGTLGLSGFYNCRNLVPSTSLTYDLGNSEKRWRSMYVGPGTINFLGNTGETTATIGVNPLGFVYTPTGFTTPTANLGAKSQSNSLIFSGGWAFTSDDDNNSIIYELSELGEGITGTQTFLNYENTSIDNYTGTIIIPNEVSAFNLNGTSTSVNIEIPTIRNQPLVLTNSCNTNATIIHNGTMYYNNVHQSGNVNISNNSVIIHWVPNWENNTSEIFIFDQASHSGVFVDTLNFVFSGTLNTFVINSSTSISAVDNYGTVESVEAFNIVSSSAYFQFTIPALPIGKWGPIFGTQNYNITISNAGTPIFYTKGGLTPENGYSYVDGDLMSIFFDCNSESVSLYKNGIFLMSSPYSATTPQRFFWYNTGVFSPMTVNDIKGYQINDIRGYQIAFGLSGPTGATGATGPTLPILTTPAPYGSHVLLGDGNDVYDNAIITYANNGEAGYFTTPNSIVVDNLSGRSVRIEKDQVVVQVNGDIAVLDPTQLTFNGVPITGETGPTGIQGPTGATGLNPYSYLDYTSSCVKYVPNGINYDIELPNNSNVFLLVGNTGAPEGITGGNGTDTSIFGMKGGVNGRVVTLLFNSNNSSNHYISFHNNEGTSPYDGFLLADKVTSVKIYKQSSITFMYSTDFFQYNNSSEGYWFMISHT